MSSSEIHSSDLTEPQHRSRERSLTSHHASRAHHDADSIVLAGSEMLLVSDARGDIPVETAGSQGLGLFYRDTRFLSVYRLTLNRAPLVPLASHEGGGAWTFHVLGNCELEAPGGRIAPHTISVRRDRMVGEGAIHEVLTLTNYGGKAVCLSLALVFAADFTDIFVVRGMADPPAPALLPAEAVETRRVELRSISRDGIQQATRLAFSPAATRLDGQQALFEFELGPAGRRELAIEISPRLGAGGARGGGCDPHELLCRCQREGREWLESCTQVRGDAVLERTLRRSLLDLKLLRTPLRGGPHYIAGGIPWFATLFGRDSAVAALEVCAFRAAIAGEAARVLARCQAQRFD
ncbi:MAG TPA: glycogen debranching N-terminal domain-containing protein, partial [Steroidobacteraceae bacterium]|nr:glycogen debranching N-terminal domain-containing protein [Steroidobacteraceae bacterium]